MNLNHGLQQKHILAFLTGTALLLGQVTATSAITLKNLPEVKDTKAIKAAKKQVSLEKQRMLFVDAEKALKKGRITKYNKLVHQLKDYPLYPYLRFMEIDHRLSASSR